MKGDFKMSNVEGQPNGKTVEETLAVVSHILSDSEFAKEVRNQNDWLEDLTDEKTAVLFLASRYQWSMALLSLQTASLKRELDGLATQISGIEDHIGE